MEPEPGLDLSDGYDPPIGDAADAWRWVEQVRRRDQAHKHEQQVKAMELLLAQDLAAKNVGKG